eukprot:5459406-Prorocentrum_lima.AAC.1
MKRDRCPMESWPADPELFARMPYSRRTEDKLMSRVLCACPYDFHILYLAFFINQIEAANSLFLVR